MKYHYKQKMHDEIKSMIEEGIEVNRLASEKLVPKIKEAADLIIRALKSNKKVLIAGNGGSASMSSHIAAEFVGRYKIERKGLPCIALASDTSIITAWSNDYTYDGVFERQLEALAQKGDVFIALSTSGNSGNLLKAMEFAKKSGIFTVALLGKDGGKMKNRSDIEIIVPSDNTPRIQEAHLMILHIICEIIDKEKI